MSHRTANEVLKLSATNGDGASASATNGNAVRSVPAIVPLLLDIGQAALLLGTSARTLKRVCAQGGLPRGAVVKPFGRRRLFNVVVLRKWIEEGCPAVGRLRRSR